MYFKEKVVIVTGSSSGIGASAAVAFAKEGAHVVIVGRKEDKMKNIEEKCTKFGQQALVIKADVTNDYDCKRIVDETIEMFGKIDVLVNNAGFLEVVDIMDDNFMEGFDRQMGLNLRGVVFITHRALPHLIKSKGNIVNISSVVGLKSSGQQQAISYCVAKACVNHFTQSTALKFSNYSVRVNAICPGPVWTDIFENMSASITREQFAEMTVLKRVSDPDEIGDLILFLASDEAKGITGSILVSDNGFLLKN